MQNFKTWFGKRVKRSNTGTDDDFKDVHTANSPPGRQRSNTVPNVPDMSMPNEKKPRNSASSFTSSLRHLLMPPEERRTKRTGGTKEEAQTLLQNIIFSHGEELPKTLSSYIALHNTRGSLCDHRSSDLLLALVLQGVDGDNRGELWLSASGGKRRMLNAQPGYFAQLCSPENKDDEATTEAIKQIDLDVGRTAGAGAGNGGSSGNSGSSESSGSGKNQGTSDDVDFASVSLSSLRKVLVATSRHLPHVGYCQSMNFLAAMLLEQLEEEEAFWVLVSIADDLLKGYYTLSLIGCRVDQRVFADLILELMPEVSNNIDEIMCIPAVGILSYHWFLTMFVTTIHNHHMLLKIWDIFFVRGARSIFQVALSIFENASDSLINATEIPDISIALETSLGSFNLIKLIHSLLGHQSSSVTETKIKSLRAVHIKRLKDEEDAMQKKLSRIRSQPIINPILKLSGDGEMTKKNESRGVRRRSIVMKKSDLVVKLGGEVENATRSGRSGRSGRSAGEEESASGKVASGRKSFHSQSSTAAAALIPFTLQDLLDIEKGALVELKRAAVERDEVYDQTTVADIDGRTLCIVDRSTFRRTWNVASSACSSGDRWLARLSWQTADEIFDAYSEPSKNNSSLDVVDFRDLLCGLSVFCDGDDRTAKLQFIYSIYDTDCNESLDHDEFFDLMSAVYSIFMDYGETSSMENEVESFVRLVFSKMGHAEEQSLCFSEFREVAVMQPQILQYLAVDRTGGSGSGNGGSGGGGSKMPQRRSVSALGSFSGHGESSEEGQSTSSSRSLRYSSVELLGKTSFAGDSRSSSSGGGSVMVVDAASVGIIEGEEPPMRLHADAVQLPFVQAMGVGDGAGQHGSDVALPNGAQMKDYYEMLRTFNEMCFDLEQCRNELGIERRTNAAMDVELKETESRAVTAERLLAEEKANSALNKQMLHDVMCAQGE